MAYSARTGECFNKVLTHSLKHAACDVLSSSAFSEPESSAKEVSQQPLSRIMLTIAGVDFRVTFLLHYADNDAMRTVIKTAISEDSGHGQAIDSSEDLDAYYLEAGNRFCGEAKRLCYQSFDHLGMSTPCVLSETTTLADMHSPDLQHEGHIRFELAGQVLLAGSVFVYSEGDLILDIHDEDFSEQEGTGELEFF